MFLIVEENPNCVVEERVFSTHGSQRPVKAVQVDAPGRANTWCDVVAVDETGRFYEAMCVQVEDSSAGSALLIFGGAWGVRLKPTDEKEPWSFESKNQWGVPFLVLDNATPVRT